MIDTSTRLTTRRFSLSASEYTTTAVAAVVSSTAYVIGGFPYLARGVVGDLTGFVLLGAAGLAARARVRHEATVCLAVIGAVVLLDPHWPLRIPEPVWWATFFTGLPEENDDLMLWEWWGEAVERLVPPATDQEARAVAATLPLTDGSGYGAAWALLHFIETAPGWPLADVVERQGWWRDFLRERGETRARVSAADSHGVASVWLSVAI